ncbi:MAG: hypothetical protein MUF36_12950 [Bacteroidales bacterium]|jgi:hypothetical protein|nr:hypothetical protein [Bacteroidales bacterium]
MKTKSFFVFLVALMIGFSSAYAQGFNAPADGKAVVYFCRVTMYGAPTSFEFFHNDKYIGVFNKKNYMRYELDPGEQLLWASSENKEFVACDLKPGGTYIIMIDVIMGAMKARVGMTPITASDERFARAKELIQKQPPVVTPQKKIDDLNVKLAKFIPEQLEKYNTIWKAEKNFKSITPDMAIPEDLLK